MTETTNPLQDKHVCVVLDQWGHKTAHYGYFVAIMETKPLSHSFTRYRHKHTVELRPYVQGEDMTHISVSIYDKEAGSPKEGDMIARNPKNHDDQWLVAAQYFVDHFESVS